MVTLTHETQIELSAGECIHLTDLRDHLLACEGGAVVLSPGAGMLAKGDERRIADNGTLVATADDGATLRLTRRQALGAKAALVEQGPPGLRRLEATPLPALPAALLR